VPECITYINFTMDKVHNGTSDLYESLFESEEEVVKSIDDLISILKEIKEPYTK
jgi:hypothetical protein